MRKVTSYVKSRKTQPNTESRQPNYKEFLWYKRNEVELLERYFGRFIVIKDEQVVADFGSKALAWQETIKTLQPGTFIIHHCTPVDTKKLPRLVNRQFLAAQA